MATTLYCPVVGQHWGAKYVATLQAAGLQCKPLPNRNNGKTPCLRWRVNASRAAVLAALQAAYPQHIFAHPQSPQQLICGGLPNVGHWATCPPLWPYNR